LANANSAQSNQSNILNTTVITGYTLLFDNWQICQGACANPSGSSGVPVLGSLTCTSCTAPGNTSPYVTTSTTPTFTFITNVNANCRVASTDENWTAMGNTRNCTSGEGATSHTCTLTSQDALPPESGYMYIACRNNVTNEEPALSQTGGLLMNGIAATAQAAIDFGIHHSVIWPGATIYTNQQVYLRDLNNNQKLVTVDRVVAYGNQRWLFNYNNASLLGLFNLTPVVYCMELNMTSSLIEGNVTALINATKT
jgi:hypothetical protein